MEKYNIIYTRVLLNLHNERALKREREKERKREREKERKREREKERKREREKLVKLNIIKTNYNKLLNQSNSILT